MAVRFQNVGDYLTLTGTVLPLNADFTQFAWVWFDFTGVTAQSAFDLFDSTSGAYAAVQRSSFNLTGATLVPGGGATTLSPTTFMGNASWRPIALVQSGTTLSIYSNGVVLATGTRSYAGAPGTALRLGHPTASAAIRISQARYWTAALTAAELLAEAASPTPVRTANLFSAYPLLSDFNDTSGNARHLSIGGGSVTFAADPLSVLVGDDVTVSEGDINSSFQPAPLPLGPTPYIVQSKSLPINYGSTNPTTISFNNPPTIGNVVVVFLTGYYYKRSTNTTLVDNRAPNSYGLVEETRSSTTRASIAAWIAEVVATGSPFTISATFIPSSDPYDYSSIVIVEVCDVAITPIASIHHTTDVAASATPTLQITTGIADALILAALSQNGVSSVTPGAGWIQVEEPNENSSNATPLSVTQRTASIPGRHDATWTLSGSSLFQSLALTFAPKVYSPGFSRDLVAVTDAAALTASPGLRSVADTVGTITEFTRLVPTTTLPLFLEVSDTVAVSESTAQFYRTTPLGSTQHFDLGWFNLPFGTGNAPQWRCAFGYHTAVSSNTTVEGSGIAGFPVTVQGRIGNVRIFASGSGTLGSWTFTLYKNGSPTNLVVVVGASGSGTSPWEVDVVPGDVVVWRCTAVLVETQFVQGLIRQTFYGDVPGESLYGNAATSEYSETIGTRTANALGWDRSDTGQWEVSGSRPAVVATSGRFTHLTIDLYGDFWGPVGLTRTFNVVKNGVVLDGTGGTPDTTCVFPVTANSTGIAETRRVSLTMEVPVVPGDYLLLQCVQAGAGSISSSTRVYVKWGMKFVADRHGESLGGHIPWDALYMGSGGAETANTNFRQGQGWNFSTVPATAYGMSWTWRRYWVWADRAVGVTSVMTPRKNAAFLTASAASVTAAGVTQITSDEFINIATDTVGVRSQIGPGPTQTGPRYSFGFTQYVGDPGSFLWETVAVTDVVVPAMSIAEIVVADTLLVTDPDTEEETIAVLEGGDLALQRRDVVTVTDHLHVIAAIVGITVVDAVAVADVVIVPVIPVDLSREVFDAVTVLDVLSPAQPSALFFRFHETVRVAEFTRTRTPQLALLMVETVTVTEGPMNLNAEGIGTTPPPPPGSTLQDYWVVGIV
jgi:hypothetical protein